MTDKEKNLSKNYLYVIDIGTEEQLKEPYADWTDEDTNIKIKGQNGYVPFDAYTKIRVINGGKEIKFIQNKVGSDKTVHAYDINAYTNFKGGKLEDLGNGLMKIMIPLGVLSEDGVKAHYVDDQGNVQDLQYTIEEADGKKYVCFITNHFSTYAISGVSTEDNSKPELSEIKVDGGKAEVPADVIKDASTADKAEVVITVPKDKEVSEINLPVSSAKEVASAKKSLTIETKTATVTLDSKALETVADKADGAKITLKIDEIAKTALSEKQQKAIKDIDVDVIISAEILDANGNEVSKDFGGGKATIKIPFTPAEGKKLGDYTIFYIADDGKMLRIPTKVVEGYLVFELEHFSEYAVALSSEVANIPLAGETPKTGDASGLAGWAVLAVLAAGTAVFAKRRRED